MAIPLYLPQQASIHCCWRLEDVNDETTNHNLTNSGTATFVPAKILYGVKIESAKYLTLSSSIFTTQTSSFSFWLKLYTEITSGTYTLFESYDGSSMVVKSIYYEYNSGTRRLMFSHYRWGTGEDVFSYNITLGIDNWYHLGWTNQATIGTTGYVNGLSVGTVTGTGSGGTSPGNGFKLGCNRTPGNYTLGYFDEFVAWDNKALSDAEMLKCYTDIPGGNMGIGFGNPWIFMKDAWERHDKLWKPKGLILPKDLGFNY